ncbi:tetrahydrofolate synthase [Faecalibacterium sp. An77]|uniref:bifunctional folylpolyglutamate synthase/dihydrofolate synthase n=1 Tax=Faecalibacterium sp. An77 TaxID=1965655 RepID=UPI000B3663CB|nr:folylpolyglutamate synthase/dihydrofolate synthase family protein [Faecalibacterium sp. An77]OUN39775.1 tetrahydrofolate synthase [Faecalibacterium sp. An77]
MTYEQALDYIHAIHWQGHKPGLERTQTLLEALGRPQDKLRFVHIAGTNGKGSTAAMLDSCLRQAGYKTGLFTSPFINRFNERIQIDGQPIPDQDLVRLVERVQPVAQAMTDLPTEFELITALGMLYFAQQHCDIVVLEVGLGGALDSTNVIAAPECAVITALGMDHVKELGPTLADIAAAKAGIIKPGCPVVSYGGEPEADKVIADVAQARHAPLSVVDFGRLHRTSSSLDGLVFDFDGMEGLTLPLLASYQPRNAAVAITALRVLRNRGWNIPDEAIRRGLAQVSWPGRFELLRRDPPFLLDGSHNAHGMRATVASLRERFPGEKFVFLISIMADKDSDDMLKLLLPLAKCFVTVTAPSPRAIPAANLAAKITALGGVAEAADTIPAGVHRADALADGGPVAALGTLYFSGPVRLTFSEKK